MLYPVYKCEDCKFENGQLIIYDGELVALVRNADDFNAFIYTLKYNAVVCPELYKSENGETVKIVIFK